MVLVAVHIDSAVHTEHLSAARLQKAAVFANADDRARCLCAGLALDGALRTVGLREKTAEIAYGEHGKPYLAAHPQLHFSLSHSGDWAVCALDDAPVGVDLEQLREVETSRFVGRYPFVTDGMSADAFFTAWTRQESYLKLTGEGLSALHTAPDAACRFFTCSLYGYCLTVCSRTAVTAPPCLFYDGTALPR